MKKREKNVIPDAREKIVVLYFRDNGLVSDLWTVEKLWDYMKQSYITGLDPLDLMFIRQNEYSLGRAEVFGMFRERKEKYGRG